MTQPIQTIIETMNGIPSAVLVAFTISCGACALVALIPKIAHYARSID